MPDGADDLAALGFNIIRCIVLERVAESIIRGDEEPTVAAILDQRAAGADSECVRVIGPVEAIGRALLAGEIRRRGAVYDGDLLLLLRQLLHGKRDGRSRQL